jgi:hypothetical protein
MISFVHKGNFEKTLSFLKRAKEAEFLNRLDSVARDGVTALAQATPVDSGKTASSWDYEIERTKTGAVIYWTNSNINQGVPIAILIQYGHATEEGAYVQGRDFINPAIRPVFDNIAETAWREVTK